MHGTTVEKIKNTKICCQHFKDKAIIIKNSFGRFVACLQAGQCVLRFYNRKKRKLNCSRRNTNSKFLTTDVGLSDNTPVTAALLFPVHQYIRATYNYRQ